MRPSKVEYKILAKAYAIMMNKVVMSTEVACHDLVRNKLIVPFDVYLAGYYHARLKEPESIVVTGSLEERLKKQAVGEFMLLLKQVNREKAELEMAVLDELDQEDIMGDWG